MDGESVSLDIDLSSLTCPISGQLFRDPVLAEDEHVYEKECIAESL